MAEPLLEDGWVDPGLAAEFPNLGITWCLIERGSGPTPPELKERLRELSNRYTGGKAVQLRQEPVPWAYRVFFRQVGLDPDEQRTPAEQAALDRMKWGGFRSSNILDDAMLVATVETGVPVMALDADKLSTEPGLRLSRPGETLGPDWPLSDHQLLVADADKPLAILFGKIGDHAGVTPRTARIILIAVGVTGVPRVSIEEALWTAAGLLAVGS